MAHYAKTDKSSNQRFFYFALLNVLSALAVIMLHANGAFWNYRGERTWAINNVIECIFYFAVPIFFMLTGATLFDYRERYDTKTFFRRRFSKILIPFVFWSLFGVFYYAVVGGHGWNLDFSQGFNALFSGSYVSIFWFFPCLICIYLAIPLFSSIKGDKVRILKYLVCVGAILNIIIPFLINVCNYFLKTNLEWPYTLGVVGGYLIYPAIGYVLHNSELSKKQRIVIYILAMFGLITHAVGTHILSRNAGSIVSLFKKNLNAPGLFYSVGVFVFIKQLAGSTKLETFIKKPVLFFRKYTFAFYLLHFFVLDILSRLLALIGISTNDILYVLIAFVSTVPICIALTFLIRKIPKVGNYLLP